MAIALDASSPALATEEVDGTCTTGSFSPPAQSLLVAMAIGLDEVGGGMSVSGGGLTWTRRVQRGLDDIQYLEIWTAPALLGASNITVTLTTDGFLGFFTSALKVDVYTGVDLAAPVGATGQGASSTNNATVSAYTATVVGSRGVAVATDNERLGAATSTDDETVVNLLNLSALMVRKAANTASLTGVTFNFDAAGTAATEWDWAALEILPVADPMVAGRGIMLGQAVQRASFY